MLAEGAFKIVARLCPGIGRMNMEMNSLASCILALWVHA